MNQVPNNLSLCYDLNNEKHVVSFSFNINQKIYILIVHAQK